MKRPAFVHWYVAAIVMGCALHILNEHIIQLNLALVILLGMINFLLVIVARNKEGEKSESERKEWRLRLGLGMAFVFACVITQNTVPLAKWFTALETSAIRIGCVLIGLAVLFVSVYTKKLS